MAHPAAAQLLSTSQVLSLPELDLLHAINDLRGRAGLAPLRPALDLTIVAGQHAADFDQRVGYAAWLAQPATARFVQTLHHWSDGSAFMTGLLQMAQSFGLALPAHGLAENAYGTSEAWAVAPVLDTWTGNIGAGGNLLSTGWNAIGIGVAGGMSYVAFGIYASASEPALPRIVGSAAADRIRLRPWADTVDAGAGDDIVLASGPGDRISGGAGVDRLYLDQAFSPGSLSRLDAADGVWVELAQDDTVLRFKDIEYLVFQDRILDASAWGGEATPVRFDAADYLRRYPDVAAAVASGAMASAEDHYWRFGAAEGRQPASFFDPAYYLATHPDVAAALKAGQIGSAFDHFLLNGQFEARSPSPFFEAAPYLANNPDVAAAVAAGQIPSALVHYLQFGRSEGRLATSRFDEAFYLAANPDVAAAVSAGEFADGLAHFRLIGQIEGRLPFEASWAE